MASASRTWVNLDGELYRVSCMDRGNIELLVSEAMFKHEISELKREISELKPRISVYYKEVADLKQEVTNLKQGSTSSRKAGRSSEVRAKEQDIMRKESFISQVLGDIQRFETNIREKEANIVAHNINVSLNNEKVYFETMELELTSLVDSELLQRVTKDNPIYATKPVELPYPKRMKFSDPTGARPPSFKAPPSDVAVDDSKLPPHCTVPVFYHYFAIELEEKLEESLENLKGGITDDQLSFVVKDLIEIRDSQPTSNEYALSLKQGRTIDRLLFSDEDKHLGACLGQYPIKGTRRPDNVVVKLKDYKVVKKVAYSDMKPLEKDQAKRETLGYFVNANEDKEEFQWALGFPCTAKTMCLQLYMNGNRGVRIIKIMEAEVGENDNLKKLLCIFHYAVHRLLDMVQSSKKPLSCSPMENFCLEGTFPGHESNRVFYNGEFVYKMFDKRDNSKMPNNQLMMTLGYFEQLKLDNIGKHYILLSYKVLLGDLTPLNIRQIYCAARIIEAIHAKGMVHADIRIGNILFANPDKAYVIDFDFCSAVNTRYHDLFNTEVQGRHPQAKEGEQKQYSHDWFALGSIVKKYFPNRQDIYNPLFEQKLSQSPISL